MRTFLIVLFSLHALSACDDLGSDPIDAGDSSLPDASDAGVDAPPSIGRVRHTELGGGVTETLADATDTMAWLALDLDDGGRELDVDIAADTTWDLALQRFTFRTNGGFGGPGSVRVAMQDGVSLADVTQAPNDGYAQDGPPEEPDIPDDVPTGEEVPTTVISHGDDAWYDYDDSAHVLTPKNRVYFIETSEHAYVAIEIVDYYSPDTGDAGHPAFRWKFVDPPDVPLPGFEVDASATDTWVYLSLDGTRLTVDDESVDPWDVAIRRTEMRTNGGVSGPGVGGAREAALAWDLASTTTVGFAEDSMLPIPGPLGSGETPGNVVLETWYDYDSTTHTVAPRADAVFVVRGAEGDYGKLRVHAWNDGELRLEMALLDRDVDERTTGIDASDAEAWVYFSFRMGAPVVPSDPSDDATWDIALSRTRVATNGGTSGPHEGAADEATDAFADVDVVAATFAVDEDIPLPGPPGSGTYSGNPSLATWFDYDPATHTVSPRDTVFIVRTADGGFVKLQVQTWADGIFGLRWAYAGAGQQRFGDEL